MQIAKILLPLPKLLPLDYIVPEGMQLNIGDLVVVSFRNKDLTSIVWELDIESLLQISKLKTIKQKVSLEFSINQEMLDFIKWVSNYYLADTSSIVKLVLPVNIAEKPIKIISQNIQVNFTLPSLSIEQQNALSLLKESNKPSIIKGVTGSGKTEIYFHLIADYLERNQQILLMLPEIALSEQIINRFIDRFNFKPILWNSSITKAQKKMILRGILSNEIKIVIGARSSLFLPYKNLGLIIIDEEHDDSYKQDNGVLYNARDMAILRATLSNIKVLLCSATPSIETIYNVNQDKYQLVELSNRYKTATLPEIQIIDMKKEKLPRNFYLSNSLTLAIRKNLDKKEQTLLFLNRRGYAPLMLCKLCGYRFTCNACSAWLVLHKSKKRLECHHCGYQSRIYISCPECLEKDSLTICGPGIERIEEEVQNLFPNSRTTVMSKDSTNIQNTHEILYKMKNSEIDILIGTQMITKGYHFPNLTLVGVIDADLGNISSGDLRSSERTYQLLHQVGGRAGREEKKGLVLMQTYYPDNLIFTHIKNGTGDQLLQYELNIRSDANMPPFTKMASIVLSGKIEHKVLEIAKNLVTIAPKSDVTILGPSSALMSKLMNKYRYRILIIVNRKFNLQKYLNVWLNLIKISANYQVKIDIDPKSFY